MSNPSNQRRRGNCAAIDHISSLPNAVICHILSFVPTKSAVKTSVLSKRWKYMWSKVPVLDFTEMPKSKSYDTLTLQQKAYFKSFVDMVLLHNDVSYVQRFCLDILVGDDNFFVKSWLGAMMRREICEIDIWLDWQGRSEPPPMPLPKRLLSCERLVVLKLSGNIGIFVPKSLHLPCLETLHLIDLNLPNDQCMKRLLSGCPALKELQIVCHDIGTLYVESLTLEELGVLHVENFDGCIIIKAPNLRNLHLQGAMVRYDIYDLCSLVEARLELSVGLLDEDDPEVVEQAYKLVEKVSGLRTLQLATSQLFEHLRKPPIFWNLTSLQLHVFDEDAHRVLKCAPMLKVLIFESVSYHWMHSFPSESELECLSCLENIKFSHFLGEEWKMRLIEYFLKAALVLKEMIIIMYPMSREEERDVLQRLLMLPRSSVSSHVNVDLAPIR